MIREYAEGMKKCTVDISCHSKMIDESRGDTISRAPTKRVLCLCDDMEEPKLLIVNLWHVVCHCTTVYAETCLPAGRRGVSVAGAGVRNVLFRSSLVAGTPRAGARFERKLVRAVSSLTKLQYLLK